VRRTAIGDPAGSEERKMSNRPSGTLLPILALIALSVASAPARADDGTDYGQGQYTAFGAQVGSPSRQAVATRIYVPLHPAQPHEVGQQFAPIESTAFGRAHAGQAQGQPGAASDTAVGTPAAALVPSLRVGKNNGVIIQSGAAPDGG
jgi:hypothetical protein